MSRLTSNRALIEALTRKRLIGDVRVKKAMQSVDRANYAPKRPYEDSPQYIGHKATISAPHMHAYCLELLKDHLARPNAKALDVGSGSGYLVACMGRFMEQNHVKGSVMGIDHISALVELGSQNLRKDCGDLLDNGVIANKVGDGFAGSPGDAPFDCIHVGAAAARVPESLLAQLKPTGRMVIPVGPDKGDQHLLQIDKAEDGSITSTDLMDVRYVPLVEHAS